MNIGILQQGGLQGSNGLTYLCMLINAINARYKDEITKTVIHYDENYPDLLRKYTDNIDHYLSIVCPYPKRYTLEWFIRSLRKKITGQDSGQINEINKILENHGVDVVFGVEDLHLQSIPWVSWIQDFQHCHLQDFFSAEECELRDKSFEERAKKSSMVILSSECACKDFTTFYPKYGDKARVMQFVANVPDEVYENNPNAICSEYNLPEKFFYVPNQFWQHKNHQTLFHAIRIAKEKVPELFVVFTGCLTDYRNPDFINQIMISAASLGIRDHISILGLIPRLHCYDLARQSIALINPSLFEGWSTSVEEAKSIGCPIILSDIDVHLEQSPPMGKYFAANSPDELADCMEEYWNEFNAGPHTEMESQARTLLPKRISAYGEQFIRYMKEAKR